MDPNSGISLLLLFKLLTDMIFITKANEAPDERNDVTKTGEKVRPFSGVYDHQSTF